MGANHSQPKDRKEERKPKRSPTLPTLLGKPSSRLNLLNLGRRSPQPATPVTPQAITPVVALAAEPDMASPEASAADLEERPEAAVLVCLPVLAQLGSDCSPSLCAYILDINTLLPSSLTFIFYILQPPLSGPRVLRRDRHAPTTRDGSLSGKL